MPPFAIPNAHVGDSCNCRAGGTDLSRGIHFVARNMFVLIHVNFEMFCCKKTTFWTVDGAGARNGLKVSVEMNLLCCCCCCCFEA